MNPVGVTDCKRLVGNDRPFFIVVAGGFRDELPHLFKPVFKPKIGMNTSVSAVLFTSKTLANGEHPLMLRLTKNRKLKYISLHLSLNAQYWDAKKGRPRRHCPNREKIIALIEQKIREYEDQIVDFKASERDYTLHTLVDKASNKVVRQTVGEYLSEYIERQRQENRIGNAMTFVHSQTAMIRCFGSLDFYFIDIDTEFLKKLETWPRTKAHYSDNSIGIRFRSLRALYNQAVADNLVKKNNYPFEIFKVSKFRETTAKRALSKDDRRIQMFTRTKYPKPFLQLAKDLFLFSYLSCGINLTDMLHLTYNNLAGDRILILMAPEFKLPERTMYYTVCKIVKT